MIWKVKMLDRNEFKIIKIELVSAIFLAMQFIYIEKFMADSLFLTASHNTSLIC